VVAGVEAVPETGNVKKNCAPSPGLVSDGAACLLDHAFGDRQAQARALLVAGVGDIAGREGREQMRRSVERHADAGVGDTEAHILTVLGDIDTDIDQAAFGEFQRIVGELQQYLTHPARIGGNARQVARGRQGQMQLLLPGAWLQQPRHGARRLQGVAILIFLLVVTVAGERDDIVDQGLQTLAGLQHHFHMVALLFGQVGALQQLRHAKQRVQRRAKFVAHVGDEGGLGLGAGLGAVARRDGFASFAL
jgi:hypothetical protein